MRVVGRWWCWCLLATPTSAQHSEANFAPISASIASQHFRTSGGWRDLYFGPVTYVVTIAIVILYEYLYRNILQMECSKCILTFYKKNHSPWLMTASVEEYLWHLSQLLVVGLILSRQGGQGNSVRGYLVIPSPIKPCQILLLIFGSSK